MDISIDFGITVTDIIKREKGVIAHDMMLSKEEPSLKLLENLFSDVNLETEINLLAVKLMQREKMENSTDKVWFSQLYGTRINAKS